jgi:hypothetical protein
MITKQEYQNIVNYVNNTFVDFENIRELAIKDLIKEKEGLK